jgi:hypothetical protein
MIARILLSPLWVLWRFYGVLWWAFNEESNVRPSSPMVVPNAATPASPAATPDQNASADSTLPGPRTQRAAQDAAFEIIDSRPAAAPMEKPTGALKLGFAASLAAGILLAVAVNSAAGHEVIKPSSQLPLWLWSFCMVFVGSLWPVRHIARRQQTAREDGWRAQVLCVAGGVKDCGAATYSGAKRAGRVSVAAGRRVATVAGRVGEGAKTVVNRFQRRTA